MNDKKSIFISKNVAVFVRDQFKLRSKNGFGEAAKLAQFLRVHPTYLSQILKGEKSFTEDHAISIAGYFNLNALETDYLMLMIQLERAGTTAHKNYLEEKKKSLLDQSQQLKNRLIQRASISPEFQQRYYSDWIYSASRLATLIPEVNTLHTISQFLDVPEANLKKILSFLVEANLLTLENGKYNAGNASTFIEGESPLIKMHHTNWRMKAMEQMTMASSRSLHYTSPMTLSTEDFIQIREMLMETINSIKKRLDPSPSEEMVCLNIDWFPVRKKS